MFHITDEVNMVGIELWLNPDGIVMNDNLLKRRIEGKVNDSTYWIIGPEDFIINKLSRTDRSPRDEEDVITVLKRQKGNLEEKYLERRAKKTGVLSLLETLEVRVRELS